MNREEVFEGPGGTLRANPLERYIAHPMLSLWYRLLLALLPLLDEQSSVRFAQWAVRIMIRPFRRLRLQNLSLFFRSHKKPVEELRRIDDAYVRYQGRAIVENSRLLNLAGNELLKKIRVEGEELIQSTLSSGRGALVVCSHVGNWVLAPAFLSAQGYQVAAIRFRIPIRAIETHMVKIFGTYGVAVSYPGTDSARAARRMLEKNGLVFAAFDVPVRPGRTELLPFGDIAMHADNGTMQLARLLNAPILRVRIQPEQDLCSTITFLPETTSNMGTLMDSWLSDLHEEVRKTPELWWPWSFARLAPITRAVREANRESP